MPQNNPKPAGELPQLMRKREFIFFEAEILRKTIVITKWQISEKAWQG